MERLAGFLGVVAVLVFLSAGLVDSAAAVQSTLNEQRLEDSAAATAGQPFVRQVGKPLVVVTGSSTVRLWHHEQTAFPGYQVVNSAFGGSTIAQLQDHYEGLIGRFTPSLVVIGSGDNDLAGGARPAEVAQNAERLLNRIERDLPDARVAIVAAKPSLTRWYLRQEYEDLNARFRLLAEQRSDVVFIDVWSRLLDAGGSVRPELYASDGLHLNPRGYRLYTAALAVLG